ncbi:MAG TPA: DNA polymerase Y family protein [Novosphingobium sp.]|nr:DNA polymerase Y family protein [Novosphingobium sp.]
MTSVGSESRRYLALWLPYLGIDRLIHSGKAHADPPDCPLALVEKVKGAVRLALVDPTAAALGLQHGMGLADARVVTPDLLVFDQDIHADAALLERLADGCMRYTPHVALDSPDALVLDLTGCTRLFGSEDALATDLGKRMARMAMRIRMAFAYAPEAALALARFQRVPAADERMSVLRLPIAALRLGTECERSLMRAGLVTVGDVARRPLAGIAARYGEGTVHAIRRMIGEADSPLAFRMEQTPFHFDRRFAEPVARTDYVMKRLVDLIAEAVTALEARDRGGRRFEAIFFRTDGLAQRLTVETGAATRDVKAVLRLFRERIDSLADPLDPGFGYDMVRLKVPLHEPLAASQLRLGSGEASTTQQVDDLVDRLSARLGRNRVRRFRPRDSHIPEQAQLSLPAIEANRADGDWVMSPSGNPPMRPLHLFDPPQRIEVLASVPDGPPYRFRWRRVFHEVSQFEGPERIASEWWRAKDGDPAHGAPTRDYYRIEDRRGRRFWIFRHGLYDEASHPDWYVHGLFA